MKKIKINLSNITKEKINIIAEYFRRGMVIIHPTDTIYGIGCLANNKSAINKIYKIKQRNKSHPLLILASSFTMIKKYCYISKRQYKYLQKIWPGSVSVILKKKEILPEALTSGIKSVAVRLPKSDFLIKIIRRVGKPIVSTSANISEQKSLTDMDNIEKYFGANKPDLVVDAGELKRKQSRLIDIRDMDDIKILRN
ncbi:MAG: L-threonylcarbamoyladenylate synthase [Patescibacteria group bacterium]|nr:L-threonylcarbamoyladenylate synthase [Patescibacteria group bacterium]